MALNERWVPILFQHGRDGETNPKTVIPGTLTDCENGTFQERITIVKRPGTRLLGRRLAVPQGYAAISGAIGLASRDDGSDLVTVTPDDRLCSYDPSVDQWVQRGDHVALTLDLDSPPRGPNEAWDVTQCSSGSVQLWAWEDLRGGVYARMRSLDTGVTYGPEFRVGGSTGRSPTALRVGHNFHLYFVSGTANTMNVAVLNPSNPTSTSASFVQLHSALSGGNPTYGVDSLENWNTSRVAIAIAGGTYLAVVREDGTIGTVGTQPSWPNPITIDASQVNPAVSISGDGNRIAVAVKGDAAHSRAVYARVLDPTTFAVVTASVTLDSGSSVIASDTSLDRIGVGWWGVNGSQYLGAWSSVSASDPSQRHVRLGYVDATALPYVQMPSASLVRHTTLASTPFQLNGRAFAWGTQVSPRQSTDFLVRDDGMVVATSNYSLAYPRASGILGRVEVRSDDGSPAIARHGVTIRDEFVAVSGGLSSFGDRHPAIMTLTYHPSASFRTADIGGVLYAPGGYLTKYDGSSVTENGFLLQVEGLSGSVGSGTVAQGLTTPGLGVLQSGSQYGPLGASGPLASASFVYEVLPVAYDAQGNEEQGGCVSLLQVYLTASSTAVQNSCSLSWNTIAHTRRNGTSAPDIRFKVFRTGFMNGSPLVTRQRVDDPAHPVVNQTGSDTVTFVDFVPQQVQAQGEVSYTQLSPTNAPTPACRYLAGAGDRLYVAGIEGAPLDVLPSKLRLDGPVAFADGASFSVDSSGGPITGIGAIDEDIAVFKATRVFHTVAAGPDNTLTDTTPYPVPQLINSTIGADPRCPIVESAGSDPELQGLVFRSPNRGFWLLQRGITMVDVGHLMRDLNGLTVVGGLSPTNAEEVRFYTAEGTTMVLNTRYQQWSTFPEQTAVAAAAYRGASAFVGSDGRVRVEQTGTWLDNSLPYPLRMTTGWLPLNGLQGLSRIRRLLVLGDFHSHHTLRVEMAVDYRNSWRVVKEIDTRTALGVAYYGGPPSGSASGSSVPGTYGSGSYGGRDPVYQFEFRLPIERFQTCRFRFTDVDQELSGSAEPGRSYSLTEMRLLVAQDNARPSLPTRKIRG